MLVKLISSTISKAAISKAAIAKFLGFPQSTRVSKEALVEQLLALLEVNPEAKAQFEEIFKSELAVGPGEFETLLQCTSLERKRWVHEGKIPVLEYRSFRKAGQDLEYPVHDRRIILSISPEDIAQWRETHQASVQERRRVSAKVAVTSKKANQQTRQDFLFAWKETVASWQQKGAELATALQLSYWTVWASRWAKENHVKCLRGIKYSDLYNTRREAWYRRKSEAMRVLAQTPYAKLTFYRPEFPHKESLYLCDKHYKMKREDFYETKWDFFADHAREIKECPSCVCQKEKDYYSLYHLEITTPAFPELRFCFHIPYPIGKTFFPQPSKLPKVDHIEQDGLFRFGRQLFIEEKITHREQDVLVHFEQALAEAKRIYSVERVPETVEISRSEEEVS
jgi:hypothetical protein